MRHPGEAGSGMLPLRKRDQVAIRIEDAELARTPRLVLERGIRVHDAQGLEFAEQLRDSRNINATAGALRQAAIGAPPEVNPDAVAGDDSADTGFCLNAGETQAGTVERHRPLDVEGGKHGRAAVQSRQRQRRGTVDSHAGRRGVGVRQSGRLTHRTLRGMDFLEFPPVTSLTSPAGHVPSST